MRFTTWPALKSAFLIFTATLPSLILADNPNIIDNPAHNGQVPGVEISFLTPLSGSNYYPGENSVISWYIYANPTGADLTGYLGNIYLLPMGGGTNYTLATLQPIQATLPPVVEEHDMATTSSVTYPEDVTTGINYYVQIESNIGTWESVYFMFQPSA